MANRLVWCRSSGLLCASNGEAAIGGWNVTSARRVERWNHYPGRCSGRLGSCGASTQTPAGWHRELRERLLSPEDSAFCAPGGFNVRLIGLSVPEPNRYDLPA